MLLILRVLFCLVIAFICVFTTLFLGTMLTRGHDNEHRSVSKSAALLLSGLLVGIFATLFFVQIGRI